MMLTNGLLFCPSIVLHAIKEGLCYKMGTIYIGVFTIYHMNHRNSLHPSINLPFVTEHHVCVAP